LASHSEAPWAVLSSWCRHSEGAARESKVAGEGVAAERRCGPVSSLARVGARSGLLEWDPVQTGGIRHTGVRRVGCAL